MYFLKFLYSKNDKLCINLQIDLYTIRLITPNIISFKLLMINNAIIRNIIVKKVLQYYLTLSVN